MSAERAPLDWFRLRSNADWPKFYHWVKRKPVNTFSGPRQDNRGKWIALFGWDDKPDSDWGRFHGNRAAIEFADVALADNAEAHMRFALGWIKAGERDAILAERAKGDDA